MDSPLNDSIVWVTNKYSPVLFLSTTPYTQHKFPFVYLNIFFRFDFISKDFFIFRPESDIEQFLLFFHIIFIVNFIVIVFVFFIIFVYERVPKPESEFNFCLISKKEERWILF